MKAALLAQPQPCEAQEGQAAPPCGPPQPELSPWWVLAEESAHPPSGIRHAWWKGGWGERGGWTPPQRSLSCKQTAAVRAQFCSFKVPLLVCHRQLSPPPSEPAKLHFGCQAGVICKLGHLTGSPTFPVSPPHGPLAAPDLLLLDIQQNLYCVPGCSGKKVCQCLPGWGASRFPVGASLPPRKRGSLTPFVISLHPLQRLFGEEVPQITPTFQHNWRVADGSWHLLLLLVPACEFLGNQKKGHAQKSPRKLSPKGLPKDFSHRGGDAT